MSASSTSRWHLPRHTVAGASRAASIPVLLLILTTAAYAFIDTNSNGVSDLWEKQYNDGNLFTSFDPQADPDGDEWTNEVEAVSGTDPSDGNPPTGCVRPTITHIPAVYTTDANGDTVISTPEAQIITWPTIAGKKYTLCSTPDLTPASWLAIDTFVSDGSLISANILLSQPDGSSPEKLFWRVNINDVDTDGDGLTDAEENALGTNPASLYSDGDYFTDAFEVLIAGSDPTKTDTNDNGIPDHEELTLAALAVSGDAYGNTYAPYVGWEMIKRKLSYEFQGSIPNGNLLEVAGWNDNLVHDAATGRFSLSSLHGTLNADIPFPSENPLKWNSSNYANIGQYMISGRCVTSGESDSVEFDEARLRLIATRPVESAITRHLLVYHTGGGRVESDPSSYGVECRSVTIPAGGMISDSQILGDDYVPANGPTTFTYYGSPYFTNFTGDAGWDNTGPEPYSSVGVGETISRYCFDGINSSVIMPAVVGNLLEIAAIQDVSSPYVTINSPVPFQTGTVTITGVRPTPAEGVQIVLRLKSDHNTIFATMRVHVFTPRDIPVTIYRIYDSRDPGTQFSGGLTDTEIIQKLNETYLRQGNVQFHDNGASSTYDLAYDKSVSPHVPLPESKHYFINDQLYGLLAGEAWDQTRKGIHGLPAPAKLIIHVTKGTSTADVLGFTLEQNPPLATLARGCFIKLGVPNLVFPHEVGHAMGLSTKHVGQKLSHDHGLWPQWFQTADPKTPSRFGLMYDVSIEECTSPWVRQDDWKKAYQTAEILE